METRRENEIQLLTVREVARMLVLSESKIRDLQNSRKLPFIKMDGSVRFEKQDILGYLKEQKRDAWPRKTKQ